MDRYAKYFLNGAHLLWLGDDYCQYYVQDPLGCQQDILDVPYVSFDFSADAEQWLQQCAGHDCDTTFDRLRTFLAYQSGSPVHEMDDRQVLNAAARELTLRMYKIVIAPRPGQAVQLVITTGQPKLPIETEPEPQLDSLIAELKSHLDALVAAQRKKFDQFEARLAEMSNEEKAAVYGKRAGKGLIVNTLEGIADLVKAIPGLYVAGLKKIWRLYTLPSRLSWATVQSMRSGSSEPLNREVAATLKPLVDTYDQAEEIASMLYVLFSDDETYALLYDFARRYYDATHPLEKTEYMAEAFSEVAMTIILAIFTAGIGAGAKILSNAGRAKKALRVLKKIHELLKRTPNRIGSLTKKGKRLDNSIKNDYSKKNNLLGPKTTPEPDPKRKKFPEKTPDELYEDIRNSKTDVANIAKHNNLKPERIQKIKDYVFNNPKFESDPDTAKAWIRLAEGKGTAHDKFLLKHETTELFYKDWIKNNPEKYLKKYDPLDAHEITNEVGFNWEGGLSKRGPRNKDL